MKFLQSLALCVFEYVMWISEPGELRHPSGNCMLGAASLKLEWPLNSASHLLRHPMEHWIDSCKLTSQEWVTRFIVGCRPTARRRQRRAPFKRLLIIGSLPKKKWRLAMSTVLRATNIQRRQWKIRGLLNLKILFVAVRKIYWDIVCLIYSRSKFVDQFIKRVESS